MTFETRWRQELRCSQEAIGDTWPAKPGLKRFGFWGQMLSRALTRLTRKGRQKPATPSPTAATSLCETAGYGNRLSHCSIADRTARPDAGTLTRMRLPSSLRLMARHGLSIPGLLLTQATRSCAMSFEPLKRITQ